MSIPLIQYPHIRIVAQGYREDSGGESGTAWWVFERLSYDEISQARDAYDLYAYSDGCGSAYGGKVVVRHSNSYTLFTQSVGLDI